MDKLYLGFDTSNYTTSIAVCNENGDVLANLKRLLPVGEGERGLRQSDAVFAHIKNIPTLTDELRNVLRRYSAGSEITAAAVSSRPRSVEGSYMPCFLVGVAVAETVCAALDIPLYKTSHQLGHVMAAVNSACKNSSVPITSVISAKHLALHVSGGTTDLLLVKPDESEVFKAERIGGTNDANAGQIIDRTGVRLGFSFPCGPYIDRAAIEFGKRVKPGKLSVNGTYFNLSGLENKAQTMMNNGTSTEEVSAFVLSYIAASIEKILSNAFEIYGKLPVVFAGGVMSSDYIRSIIGHLGYFSDAEFSSDNASGCALLASRLHKINSQK